MPLSQTGPYTKSDTMLMSQTWSYTKQVQCQRPKRGLTCNSISMPLSQTGSYTKSDTMLMSQTWSYT
ncbi:hypothetical protein F383_02481 [Gossypium arboreum]|uniref:Uncharacterized protein n=1 Tax=Gossypium arboreum TaxID=29729 RepID=A0A0B0PCU2_GOSAR|nr:hypothetical protein F383_02481 [Gossypium arboreum]